MASGKGRFRMKKKKGNAEIKRLRDALKELRRRSRDLESQSRTDDLTGQYNRRHILVELDREVERAVRYGRHLSGMMIDVDDFKKVNDRYGHTTGDQVLKQFAEVLAHSIRNIDILGRYGGDEFLVILPESTFKVAKAVAERIRENVAKRPFQVDETALPLTASIGLISFEDVERIDKAVLIERIDQAMLNAKRLGKNTIAVSS